MSFGRVVAVVLVAACGGKPDPVAVVATREAGIDAAIAVDAVVSPIAIALPPAPPLPKLPVGLPPLPTSMLTITPDLVALGALLFYEPRLASDGKLTCASCHDPAHDYAGGIDKTVTGAPNLRRTPSLSNLAWAKEFGWDGRFPTLDTLLDSHLRGQLGDALEISAPRLAANPTYRAHFARVHATPEVAMMAALEAFVLTRYDGDAPWDRVEDRARVPRPADKPDDVTAGYVLFAGKAQCASCHTPPLYTDFGYHHEATGKFVDAGHANVDGKKPGAFRTPGLRGAARRTSFDHDGGKPSLEAVVDWYADAAAKDPHATEPVFARIQLAPDERRQVVAFVRALSSDVPPAPRPSLP